MVKRVCLPAPDSSSLQMVMVLLYLYTVERARVARHPQPPTRPGPKVDKIPS